MPAVRGMLRVTTATQLAAVLPLTAKQREATRELTERSQPKPNKALTRSNGSVGAAIAGRRVAGGARVTGGAN